MKRSPFIPRYALLVQRGWKSTSPAPFLLGVYPFKFVAYIRAWVHLKRFPWRGIFFRKATPNLLTGKPS